MAASLSVGNLSKLSLNLSTSIFVAPLMCPAPNSPGVLTSSK
jgi:hypothetical protein